MRHSFTHSGVRATVGATMALSLVVAGFAPASHAVVGGPGGPSPAAAAAAAGSFSIPLITGDTLHITNVEDDRRTVELELGAGREGVTVHQMEIDGELVVLRWTPCPTSPVGGSTKTSSTWMSCWRPASAPQTFPHCR